MVGVKISERNPEYAAPEGFYRKMKKLMQHLLELAQCYFFLYFADARPDEESAGDGLQFRKRRQLLCDEDSLFRFFLERNSYS
jgi:hypothetical protein